MPNFKRFAFGLVIVLAVMAPVDIFAQGCTVDGKYFKVTVHQGVDKPELLKKLHADYFLQMGAAFSADRSNNADIDRLLARTLDAIYLDVSDILDIHMYDFSVDLEIFPDKGALANELQSYFGKRVDMPSYYFYDKNKIAISCADMTLGMLSHEIAHSIISHYFVVQPSAKVQEVLAGYVEYSVRKSMKELPDKNRKISLWNMHL